MSLRDELLAPIAGDNPAGVDMRYDPLFDKIKEARREDDDVPQGEWQSVRKVADWPVVIRLAKDALSSKTKDLQLAAWLTEAQLRREGFAGLRDGLDLLTGLVEQFWDTLYPEIDDGDAEMRAAPLEWVSVKLDVPVRLVPIDRAGHSLLAYKDSRTIPTEESLEAEEDSERRMARAAVREEALASGKIAPEVIEAGFTATPKTWYRTLVADTAAAIDALKALDEVASAKFGDVAPNFSRLSEALDEVLRFANQQLKRKLELDPDPIEAVPESATSGADADAPYVFPGAASGGQSLSVEPTSLDDAAARIVGAARYLRQNAPFNPASYLMVRGFRWGELRSSTTLDPKLLDAPPTSVRTKLKGLLLDAKWPELLEAGEGVMGTPQGRGWLDLQRYVLTALESLGSDYDAVATALRGALRSLIADLPQLLDMTLMDDTPTANAETRAWLRNAIHVEGGPVSADNGAGHGDFEPPSRDPIEQANAEVRAGRAERAIALLMRESSREKTRRGRFLYQSQLARIMVDAGHEPVAMPILEELIADIEAYKLEEWEAGPLVAAPMSLLFRCLENAQGDEGMRQSLYLRICRLDPIQAISFGPR